ncbi:MAG: lipopolysaccharide biosynthesis protein [Treponemataceae bacterium]|nr:lipopolysaccharide biosynthesis protein [Treponemataceae bacterium]
MENQSESAAPKNEEPQTAVPPHGTETDEISLIDLLAVLLRHKALIIGTTVFAMVFAVVISIISLKLPPDKSFLPNQYTCSANMLINDSSSAGGTLSSMLSSSGLGALAGMAGISAGGSTYSALAIYLASSNPFLDAIVDNFNLLAHPKLEKSKSPKFDSRKMVKEQLSSSMDDESGVFTLSFTDIDPEFAQAVVNFSVDWLQQRFDELGIDKNKIQKENLEKNIDSSFQEIQSLQDKLNKVASSVSYGQPTWNIPSIALETTKLEMELTAQQEVYKQMKTQYELLKIEMQSETPVFQIIERPEIPDRKSKPSRGLLCIIITFAGFFIAVFFAFALNAWENIRNDSEAMAKLTQPRKAGGRNRAK